MENRPADFQFERVGNLGRGCFPGQNDNGGLVNMAAFGDLVGDVAHFKQRRITLALGDEGADALNAHELALVGEFSQRSVGGHLADAKFHDQLVFRGNTMLRRPFAALDPIQDHLFDAGVKWAGVVFSQLTFPIGSAAFIAVILMQPRISPVNRLGTCISQNITYGTLYNYPIDLTSKCRSG